MKKLIVFLFAAVLIISFSCKKKPINPISEKPTFTINGVVVKDLNDPAKDIASFTVWRDDVLFNGATVKVGNQNIPNVGSGSYYAELPYNTFQGNTTYIDSITSPQDTVTITFSFTMPDTFSAEIQSDKDTFNVNDFPIIVNWTASGNADGYFISVAKGDTISGANLDSATTGNTQYTLLLTAFQDVAGNLVTGDYCIYVGAYDKSFVYYPETPFALPAGLPTNNITGAKGTIGAGVIAKKVTITLVTLSQ